MSFNFLKIMFLAENDGGEGWAQLLVFVVMAVIYGLAALAKSRSEKNVDFDEEEDEKVEKSFARPQQKLKQQQGGERATAGRSGPLWEPFELEEMKRQQGLVEEQGQELEFEIKRPTVKEVVVEHEEEAGVEIRDILDFESSEDLQKAILHYEILGKPVSMRKGPV